MSESDSASFARGDEFELSRITDVLDLARRDVNRQEPDLALAQLRSIRDVVDNYEGTPQWAEYRLLTAEAYAAKDDLVADEFFNEALRRIAKLHAGNGVLALRAHKNYGKFLATRSRCLSRARQQLEYAKQLAVTSRLDEECADISLKMEQVDLDERKDPRRKTFKLLKGTGYRLHATSKQVLAAWHQYLGNMEAASEGLGFARDEQPPSETYLDNLLRSVMDKLQ